MNLMFITLNIKIIQRLNVVNGMPSDIAKQAFPKLNLHPLSKEKLEDLLKGTSLPLHYPELLETR